MPDKLLTGSFFVLLEDDGCFTLFALNTNSADELRCHTRNQAYVTYATDDTALGAGLRFLAVERVNSRPPQAPSS
jgi:hypothetical protein